ncbi:DNA polymerase III subunit delta [Neolewinella lacunae]|uniref:DNA polymerase III subunit delta n=1 Tax=Neolewinella lacunae TaxID=1517758 RepID=A0A923TDI3_9BACT|nr:DNA polymerase III subunit delta [Neolewinella lacunae]MBC6994872.1 DNA polymerase III subunit delta [Neolewinella lacunae]MDN3636792.1 DNA polymerase III subunit delta [Neolewinella lacunae]
MEFAPLLKAIKNKEFAPLYLLHGEEAYFIDQLEAAIGANALQEHERAFNETILYGKDAEYLHVIDAARRFPMMAERQLVLLREAQDMRSLKDLVAYAEKPSPTTILVISHKHKKLNGNLALAKALKKNGVVFEAKALYENKVPGWIEAYLKERKYSIEPAAANLLAEFLGTSLGKISNELDKLLINLAPGTKVSTQIVEDQVGVSKDYNVFELQKAIGHHDIVKATRILNYFRGNPKAAPLPMVLGSLYNYFSKVFCLLELQQKKTAKADIMAAMGLRFDFFLTDYQQSARNFGGSRILRVFALLKEYDLKSKGVDSNLAGKQESELLKELVWKMMHLG